jgi:chemotaxis protein CheD
LSKGSGRKQNLEIKVFGGGKINAALDDVGAKNIEFVRQFLADEGYILDKEDLGGSYARRVMFKPYSGRAFVKRLDNAAGATVAKEELLIVARPVIKPPIDDIELF